MKKTSFARSLAVLLGLVLLCGCAAPAPSIGAPASGGTPAAQPAERNTSFFPVTAAYSDYKDEPLTGAFQWEQDGSIVVQDKNRLLHLSPENELLETVTLDPSLLPAEGYRLFWNDERILALRWDEDSSSQYAMQDTGDGVLSPINLTLFDRQGNLVRQYPSVEIEDGVIAQQSDFYSCKEVFWLDADRAVFFHHFFVIVYDFSAQSGSLIENMLPFTEPNGRLPTSYGMDDYNMQVFDGKFYYLASHTKKWKNQLFCIAEDGAQLLLDGVECFHLERFGALMIAATRTEDGHQQVYLFRPNEEPEQIWQGTYFTWNSSGAPGFLENNAEQGTCLYLYDSSSGRLISHPLGEAAQINSHCVLRCGGELCLYYLLWNHGAESEWVWNAERDTLLPLESGTLAKIRSVSPTGERYLEQDPDDRCRMRVSLPPAAADAAGGADSAAAGASSG